MLNSNIYVKIHFLRLSSKYHFQRIYRLEDNLEAIDRVKDLPDIQLKFMQVLEILYNDDFLLKRNVNVSTDDFFKILWNLTHFFDQVRGIHEFFWLKMLCPYPGFVPTLKGMCESFNIADADEVFNLDRISPDFNYSRYFFGISECSEPSQGYPLRSKGSSMGVDSSLYRSFLGDDPPDLGPFEDQVLTAGFRIFFHHPYELPTSRSPEFSTLEKKTIRYWISPKITTIDESLVEMSPEDRNCFLPDEKPLNFFKVYTKVNCEHECMSSAMLKACGCVEFFMVRDSNARICGVIDKPCFDDFKAHFDTEICQCLRPCHEIDYQIESEILTLYKKFEIFLHDPKSLWHRFKIYFKDNSVNEMVRRKQYDFVDAISFIGGLFSLAFGFSFLSLTEIIYWFVGIKKIATRKSQRKVRCTENAWQNKTPKRSSFLKKIILNYLENSSPHGFNYMATSNRFENIFWFLTFAASMTCSLIIVAKVGDKVPNSRIIAVEDNLLFDQNVSK